eukprot:g5606.t1
MSDLTQHDGINLNALDSMVYSYMLNEGLTEESTVNDSGREVRRRVGAIKDLILAGELKQSKVLIEELSPEVLKEPEIQFRLKKQILIELLREGNTASEGDALNWMRRELAPVAKDAFPEAYEEFKKTLLMFVFEEKKENSPVAYEWSHEARQYLAELIFSTLKFCNGFKDPDLVNVLRYLLLHATKWQTQETSEQEKELMERISVESRMPSPITIAEGGSTQITLQEEDVSAIMTGANVTRSVAEEALRRSKGDVSTAFDSELSRVKLKIDQLNALVLEYAGYRGMLQLSESESEEFDSKDDSPTELKCDSESSETTGSYLEIAGGYPVKKLKRSGYRCDKNLKIILRLLRKVRAGKYVETIEQICELDSGISQRHPQLIFELWRFEILRVASLGNHDVALDILRKNLTPFVKSNNELFPALQETLNFIMSPKLELPLTSNLCTELQAALQQSMNLPGPQLVYFMTFLLERHQEWFRKQSFQDIFSKNLGIDVLLHGRSEIRVSSSVAPPPPPPPDRPNNGETVADSMEWESGSSDDSLEISEDAVNQVMAVLNFPRDLAVDLLRQHEGNLESAVNQVLAQSDEQ